MIEPALYRWPVAAKFGRVVPKARFVERTAAGTLRGKFAADVQRITWAYKLADATIHLRGDAAVPEIEVFVIEAKEADVSDDVLTAIDKAVQFPIVFEISRGIGEQARTRMVAAHKQLGGTRPRLSVYFSTDWQPDDAPRAPLPPSLDLPALYAGLLRPLLPLPARPGEHLAHAIDRVDQARKLEREMAALEKRLRNEPQLNRKIELRRELRERAAARDTLNASAPEKTEDAL
jgi:hypothetical protein